MSALNDELFSRAIAELLGEAFAGPGEGGSWFTDSEPDTGVLGTLNALDARAASRPLASGDGASAASHAAHLRYALSLANRAMRGENPYRSADWAASWAKPAVNEAEWEELKAGLAAEVELLKSACLSSAWTSDMLVKGMIGNVAHSAWHLGALRQGLGLVRSPENIGRRP